MEEYKKCFEDYEISNFGNLRRKLNNGEYKNIKGSIMNKGYRYIQLIRNGKRKNLLFHHLVACIFIGERPEKFDIDHIDRNKLNNNVLNLRYISHKDNCKNTDRYIDLIPESEDRKKVIHDLYYINNIDKIKENKKKYYLNNKAEILTKDKIKRESDKTTYICEECNKEYTIQRNSLRYKKTNKCGPCNLKILNN